MRSREASVRAFASMLSRVMRPRSGMPRTLAAEPAPVMLMHQTAMPSTTDLFELPPKQAKLLAHSSRDLMDVSNNDRS